MRLKITLLSLVIAALLAAGCGSSGSSSSSSAGTGATSSESAGSTAGSTGGGDESGDGTTGSAANAGEPLTKAQFIKQGDAVCAEVPKEYGEKLQALEAENKKQKKPKPSKAESTLKAAVPPLFVAVEGLEGLAPPQGDEQKAAAIVVALQSAAAGLEEKPTSELSGPKSPFAEFQKLTKAYGFEGCSQL